MLKRFLLSLLLIIPLVLPGQAFAFGRIDGSTATSDHKFTQGNPATGTPATIVTDSWLNDVQEGLANVITDSGQTPTKGVNNQLAQATIIKIPSLSALKNFSPPSGLGTGNYVVYVEGRNSAGDGYQGLFRWDSSPDTSKVVADSQNGVYAVPNGLSSNGSAGCWKRQYSGAIKVEWFGASSSYVDSATAVQAACDFAGQEGDKITGENDAIYYLGSEVQVDKNKIIFDVPGTFRPYGTYSGYLFNFSQDRNGTNYFDGSDWLWPKEVSIKSLNIDGRSPDNSSKQSKAIEFRRLSHAQIHFFVEFATDQAVKISGVIESDFFTPTIRLSGGNTTVSSDAPLYFIEDGTTEDASNNDRFYGLNIAYPAGAMLYAQGTSTKNIRNMFFFAPQIHHMDSTITGTEGNSQPGYDGPYPAASATLQSGTSLELRNCYGWHFFGGNIRQGQNAGGTLIKFGDSATSSPVYDITFHGTRFTGEGAALVGFNFDDVTTNTGVGFFGCPMDMTSGSGSQLYAGDGTKANFQFGGKEIQNTLGATTDTALDQIYNGETYARFSRRNDGMLSWGDGSNPVDTSLYRASAGILMSDGNIGAEDGFVIGSGFSSASALGPLIGVFPVKGPGGGVHGWTPIYGSFTP